MYGGMGQLEGYKVIGNIDARSSITDWMVATRSRGGEVLGFLSCRNRDGLAFCLFNSKNRISVEKGQNHWIPFTEAKVGAQGLFASHFMTDYMGGRLAKPMEEGLFRGDGSTIPNAPIEFGEAAQNVFAAGRGLLVESESK